MPKIKYFRVKNFDKLQHYKDRGPKWIKLYNELLTEYHFSQLSDAGKFHAIAIMLLASRYQNRIPLHQEWIQKTIYATEPVNLDALFEADFIELIDQESGENTISEPLSSKTLPERYQDDSKMLSQRRVEKRREEEININTSISQIFDHWRSIMNSPKSVLDKKRTQIIEKALKNFTPDDLCLAISGCAKSPWHMGSNPQNTKYNGIELILRDAGNIEKFKAFYDNPPNEVKNGKQTSADQFREALALIENGQLGNDTEADETGYIDYNDQ